MSVMDLKKVWIEGRVDGASDAEFVLMEPPGQI